MNSKVLILIAASVLFVGCSKDDNKKSDGGFEIQQDFKPNSVPADAMSDAEIADLMQSTSLINSLVPQEDAILKMQPSGGRIENIPTNKKHRALEMLSPQGSQILQNVLANCQISEPQGTEFSSEIHVREMQSSQINASISGDLKRCPLNVTTSSQSQRVYSSFEKRGNAAAGTFEQTFGTTQTMSIGRHLSEISGLRGITLNMAMKANITSSINSGRFQGHMNGRGTYTLDYTNGERLSGDVQFEAAFKNQTEKQQIVLNLRSSKGTLRLVFIMNGEKKTAYVNGKAVPYETASRAYIPHGVTLGN